MIGWILQKKIRIFGLFHNMLVVAFIMQNGCRVRVEITDSIEDQELVYYILNKN